jgi:glycyl-tRNA synthetase beta chain
MGTYYALADGEPAEVAVAIREHYLPRGAGDALPETHAGLTVAIADKLDTLAGIFDIGEKPTGAKDPFGLRRAAIGLLRILIEKRLDLDLRKLIGVALANARADVERLRASKAAGAASSSGPNSPTAGSSKVAMVDAGAASTRGSVAKAIEAVVNTSTRALRDPDGPATGGGSGAAPAAPPKGPKTGTTATSDDQVYDFIMERLRAYYLERTPSGIPGTAPAFTTEMFDAVLATKPASPLDFDARLNALRAFLDLPEAISLAAANKRIANILRKAGELQHKDVDVECLKDPAEVRLFDAMRSLKEAVTTALGQREYANALGRLAQLRPPVDAFFEQVMVMDEDPRLRANRLALLAQLHGLFIGIADLSRLPG